MFRRRSLAVLALALFALPLQAQEQPEAAFAYGGEKMIEAPAASLAWAPLEIPGFDPGTQLVVITGDPSKSGPYVLRLKFPDGYSFPAHYHPMAENLTVMSGKFFLAMGETEDPGKLKKYKPGDFIYAPAKMPHYGRVEGETIVQLHGEGPFEVYLVEKAAASK